MKNYDIYKYARDMAWQFLIDNNVLEHQVFQQFSEFVKNRQKI